MCGWGVQRPALRLNESKKTVARHARESHETKIRKYIIIIEVKVVSYYESLNSSSGTSPVFTDSYITETTSNCETFISISILNILNFKEIIKKSLARDTPLISLSFIITL
jgi:hypothetical protein